MYGQMTAGSWIYIGTQGILQGTYETFAAVAAKRFGGSLAGTITLTAGLGGMGGAQPLAVTMNGGVAICVDVRPVPDRPPDRARLPRRGGRRRRRRAAARGSRGQGRGRAAVDRPARQRRRRAAGAARDAARRSTSSPTRPRRTTRSPTCRAASRSRTWRRCGPRTRPGSPSAARAVHGRARRGDGRLPGRRARRCSTTATRSAARRELAGYERAFAFPGFVPAYIRPLFCEGKGPFRWAALSGDPADIAATDRGDPRPVPGQRAAGQVDPDGRGEGALPGPAGPDLLARLRRAAPGRPALQRAGRARATCQRPDRARPRPPGLRLGRLAVPGDRGDGRRLRRDRRLAAAERAGQHRLRRVVGVASTTAAASASAAPSTPARSASPTAPPLAGQKLERVLTNDPGMGVIRHVDAGYDRGRRGRRRTRRPHPDERAADRDHDRGPHASGAETRLIMSGAWRASRLWERWCRRAGPGHRRLPALLLDRRRRRAAGPGSPGRPPNAACGPTADRNGNLWAWWDVPGAPAGQAVVTGSHLDSVPDGGAFDGPLGVVSAFAAIDLLAGTGLRARPAGRGGRVRRGGGRPVRGGLPGQPAADRRHRPGRGAGADRRRRRHAGRGDGRRRAGPGRLGPDADAARTASARSSSCTSSRAARWPGWTPPVGVGRADLAARPVAARRSPASADHAGTATLADRHDPMLPYAAHRARRPAGGRQARARWPRSARSSPSPAAANAISSRGERLAGRTGAGRSRRWQRLVDAGAGGRAELRRRRTGVGLSVVQESVTPAVDFDLGLRGPAGRGTRRDRGIPAPLRPTGAGHDAGVLAARVPTAMLFVRNPTGVSHSPAEHAERADCEAGVRGPGRRAGGPGLPVNGDGTRRWLADLAWLPGAGVRSNVLIESTAGASSPCGPTRPRTACPRARSGCPG